MCKFVFQVITGSFCKISQQSHSKAVCVSCELLIVFLYTKISYGVQVIKMKDEDHMTVSMRESYQNIDIDIHDLFFNHKQSNFT